MNLHTTESKLKTSWRLTLHAGKKMRPLIKSAFRTLLRTSASSKLSSTAANYRSIAERPERFYSTSKTTFNALNHLSVTPKTNSIPQITQYESWTCEETLSVLMLDRKQGGAGLSEIKLRPLKDSLDGMMLLNIAMVIQDKDAYFAIDEMVKWFSNVDKSTCTTIVFWVRDKIVNPISFKPSPFDNLAYQNNKNTVEMMADVLLKNIWKHMMRQPLRDQELLINSAYFGSGKTRLGVEFLTLWKNRMAKHPEMRENFEADYSKAAVEQLEQSKLVYIDCRKYRIINNNLRDTLFKLKRDVERYIGGTIESIPCYIVIDEIGSWVQYYEPAHRPNIHRNFSAMYDILNEFISELQQIPTVSLYVCGKGAFLDIVGQGKLRPTLQSPSIIKAIHLEALSRKHVESGIVNSNLLGSLISHFKELNLFDYFLDQIQQETQGVPIYVVLYVFENFRQLLKCKTKEDIDNTLVEIRSTLSKTFSAPFEQFSNHPVLMSVYQSLLFAGILKLEATKEFNMDSFKFNTKGTEFEGITSLGTYDIASMLNCFLQPVNRDRYQLLFPQAIIDEYVKSSEASSRTFAISHMVEEYGLVLSLGNVMEQLTLVNFTFRMNWGSIQRLNIGEVIPLLKSTCVGTVLCKALEVVNLGRKLMSNEDSNLKGWKEVLPMLDGGKLGYFYDQSHSPDKIWQINLESEKVFVMIQDKNVEDFTISQLKKEIEKNEKIRKALQKDETKLIMIFMVRGKVKFSGQYPAGTAIEGIQLHQHTSVIIPTEEEISDFLGDRNREALEKLSGLKKTQ